MSKTIAAIVAALFTILASAGCASVGIKTYNTAEEVAEAIGCANVRTEGSILGDVTACNVGEASFGILTHTEQIEQAWHQMSQISGGAYARVGKFLVSSSDTAAAEVAFDKLGVEGTFVQPSGESSGPTAAPSEPTDGEPTGEPSEGPTEGEPSEKTYEEDVPDELSFGKVVSYEDGVSIQITRIRYEEASDTNCCVDEGTFIVVFTFRVVNGSDASLKDYFLSVSAAYGEESEEAEDVSDASGDTGIRESISGITIRKGKAKVGEYAFAIPKKQVGDVQIEVGGGFEHESVLFYGAAKEQRF